LWSSGGAHAAGKITWEPSLAAATADAKTSHKLIMADFYTDWCGWCKKLDNETYTDNKVVSLVSDQFVPVKINAEKEGIAVAKKYEVNGYPNILFISEDGTVESRIDGFMVAKDFADKLTTVAQVHRDFPTLLDRARKDPNDIEADARLAAAYADRGDGSNAGTYLTKAEAVDPQNSKDLITKAYNALGDYYQRLAAKDPTNLDKAVPLFRKAGSKGKIPKDRSYGYMSAIVCNLSQQKPEAVIPDCQAILDMDGASKDDKDAAQLYLKQAMAIIKQQIGK
jgi:thiol-disulfide isomerase/thioredoxin